MKIVSTKVFFLLELIFLLSSCKAVNQINTVSGEISTSQLGMSLTHEHVMSNFGKGISETSHYDNFKLFNQVIPYLKELKSLGVNTIFDCTTEYFGRRVDLLKKISDSTGIHIVTNTGYYGAANDQYIPEFAYELNSKSISEIWIDEFKNGIHGTGIKPGFIKVAFDDNTPSDIDKKLFESAIFTHLSTGLTIAAHTGGNIEAAKLQVELLQKNKVRLSAWIWTHANKVKENELLMEFAAKGAWISLDGVNESNTDEYIQRIKLFKQNNLLNKILISHDGNGFPRGGKVRKFEALFKHLIPAMLKNGFTEEDVNQLLVKNPKEAFKIMVRKTK